MTYQYIRKAHYHETDQMGIIHHTNYIKWFEEARIAMMADMGVPYGEMEAQGIISPVLHISCDYGRMVRFDDEVVVHTSIMSYTGVKFSVAYKVTDAQGETVYVTGQSNHCFLNQAMRPVILKKSAPAMDAVFSKALELA